MKKLLLLLLLTIAVPITVCSVSISSMFNQQKPKEAAKPGHKWVQAPMGNTGGSYWTQVPEHYTLNPGIGMSHWGPPGSTGFSTVPVGLTY